MANNPLMGHAEIVARIQQLRMRVLRMVRGVRMGDHLIPQQSASGMEFDGLREYQQGDDVRRIDWSSSVRSNAMMVRMYREQENRTIVLLLDLSATTHLGSTHELKDAAMQTIALMIGCSADLCGDAVGVIVLNNGAVSGVPPSKGRRHMMRCAELILAVQGAGSSPSVVDVGAQLEHLVPRHACLFFITDGLMESYKALCLLIKRRAVCGAIRVRDMHECEARMPQRLLLHDAQCAGGGTGVQASVIQEYARAWYAEQDAFMASNGIRMLDVVAGHSYDLSLKLFLERGV
jgi:uncharacterized protein (DUF58 family)